MIDRKKKRFGNITLLVFLFVFLVSCSRTTGDDDLAKDLMSLEDSGYSGRDVPVEVQAVIKGAVKRYKEEVAADVLDTETLGILYKRIAKKYLDIADLNHEIAELAVPGFASIRNPDPGEEYYYKLAALKSIDSELYGMALVNLKAAIEIDTGNHILYYLAGVSAGWLGKSAIGPGDEEKREALFESAELYYKRAIELEPQYVDGLYALAVLLVFEFEGNRLKDAETYVNRIFQKESMNTKAFFLMAIIYDQMAEYYGNSLYYGKAITQYEQVLSYIKAKDIKARAAELKEVVENKLYESRKSSAGPGPD